MRTKASIKGHAIHQMLIPFPIAFFMGAFASDLLGFFFNTPSFSQTAFYMSAAGVIMGLSAGVFGYIDYMYSVPPDSTGFQRATKHMVLMLLTITMFAVAWFLREDINNKPDTIILLLEATGAITVSLGGWMGGTLVNRNFIGPDHRYAQSGKWKEQVIDSNQNTIEVSKSDELKINQMKLLHFNNERIVLARTEKGYTAFQDRCTHRGGSLADGVLICDSVQCLWHGSQFDVNTGSVKYGPAKEGIRTYSLIEQDGKVFIRISKQ